VALHEPGLGQGHIRCRKAKEGRKEGGRRKEGDRRKEGRKRRKERGTYGTSMRVVGAAAGQYCDCRETECGPPKGFNSLKLAAPAIVDVNEQACTDLGL